MEKTRPILYGVADYAEIRKSNAWFVDRTAKIRDLEATRYAVFLRPRRFGKSLLVSMLRAYYDVQFANRFEEFFSGRRSPASTTTPRSASTPLRRRTATGCRAGWPRRYSPRPTASRSSRA